MARSAIILLTTTLCLTLLALSQNSPPSAGSSSSAMIVTAHDNGKTIDLPKAATLVVELESNPSTGYSWAVRGDSAPLKLLSSDYKQSDQSGKVGAPGVQQFRFEAGTLGTSSLKLIYRRPWEKDVAPAKTFALVVKIH